MRGLLGMLPTFAFVWQEKIALFDSELCFRICY